jgi:hypothetical protein
VTDIAQPRRLGQQVGQRGAGGQPAKRLVGRRAGTREVRSGIDGRALQLFDPVARLKRRRFPYNIANGPGRKGRSRPHTP